MKIIEITKVFTMKKYPKKLTKDEGIDIYSDEYLIACLLVEKFGGSLKVLKANQKTEHIKYADYLWNGKLWELKRASSLTAIDNRIRVGLKQIAYKPGGIVIYINQDLRNKDIINRIVSRMHLSDDYNHKVLVIKGQKVLTVLIKK